jgi:hypothetical protein
MPSHWPDVVRIQNDGPVPQVSLDGLYPPASYRALQDAKPVLRHLLGNLLGGFRTKLTVENRLFRRWWRSHMPVIHG